MAQTPSLSPQLRNWKNKALKQRSSERVDIVVTAVQQPNLDSLNVVLNNQRVPRKERGRYVVEYLTDFADKNQVRWSKAVEKKNGVAIKDVFWVANFVQLEVSTRGLELLAKDSSLAYIELSSEQRAEGHFPIPFEIDSKRAIGGVEPGLEAVQSRFLWNLGYTGKGQKIMNLDTGVWPDHPAAEGRFLGQRGPLSHAWLPFDLFLPGDKANSHGTHTNGTSIGLEKATDDTIGMAFNAYYIASDPIVSNAADIRNVVDLVKGFQWALNPDGDASTTDDMPDVINNSWGRPYIATDTMMCGTFVDMTLQAMEVAGIMSFQSAGNSGPGSGTVGFPAGNNPTITSNFAVGAINAAVPSWPIAGFSSRGPSACGDTGSLLIKPEVVAPGVGVRSAIRLSNGTYTYDSYQGTSMAAPHVSGIALLLAEAFPTASAQDIKMALYYSATDLGDPGEDNVYGNGMIQAEAAYQFLLQAHTPSIPSSSGFDVNVLRSSLSTNGFMCAGSTDVTVYLESSSTWSTSDASLSYGIWGGNVSNHTWSTSAKSPSDSEQLTNVAFTNVSGWVDFYVELDQTNPDDDVINNRWFDHVYILHEETVPFVSEWDEDSWLEEMNWYVNRGDDIAGWDTAQVFTPSGDNQCARMQLHNLSPREGQRDYILSPKFSWNSGDANSLFLSFDYASQFRFSGFRDSLEVFVSTDCGDTWNLVKSYDVNDLNTTTKPAPSNTPFVPTELSDWKSDTLNISQYRSAESLIVKIETVNGGGNDVFIDRVAIFDEVTPVSVDEAISAESVQWSIYPNPAKETIQIEANGLDLLGQRLQVSDIRGSVVKELTISSNQPEIDLTDLPSGYYVLTIGEESTSLVIE